MSYGKAGMWGPEVVLNGSVTTPLPLPATSITVKNMDGSAATCYTDRTAVTTTSNVIVTDAMGQLTFFAMPGQYKLHFTNSLGAQMLPITVHLDPADLAPDVFGSATYQTFEPLALFVDPVTGSDSDTGTSWLNAFLTLNAAKTSLGSAAGKIYLRPGGTHPLTAGISIDVSKQNIVGFGSIIDTTALGASTTAITLTSSASSSYWQRKGSPFLPGIELNGGASNAGSNVALKLAGVSAAAEVAHLTVGPLAVHGYGIGVRLGDHCHSVKIEASLYNCGTGIDDALALVNCGERISFEGSIFNSNIAVSVGNDLGDYVFSGSFDYNTTQFIVGGPTVTLLGAHIEGNDATYGANYPVALSAGYFRMLGGIITGAATAIPGFINNTATDGAAVFSGVSIFNNRWFSSNFSPGTGITSVTGTGGSLAVLTEPTFPADGVPLRNPFPVAVEVHINGGSITGVSVDGVGVGNQSPIRLAPSSTITISWTGSPTWVWTGINY